MKRKLIAIVSTVILLAVFVVAYDAVARMRSAATMAAAATKFLNTLTPEQKAKAVFKFDDEQRFDWHFVPRDRKGLPLKEMNEAQKQAAMELLKSGLSARGFWKANTIINTLELVLQHIEGANRRWPRDPGLYYVSIFGAPSTKQAWGWRFEGHHLAQNFTINGSSIVATSPAFFGTNPAEVRAELPQKGLRVLAAEEDLARELIQSLDDKQRARAIYDPKAPADIFTMNQAKIAPLEKVGITAAELSKAQFAILTKLIDEYCNNVPEDLAAARREKFTKAKRDEIYFAWAGGIGKNDPNYHRIQTPQFLIEFDDTQNDANHIHSVWRDFNGDFGRDLLAEHYQSAPHNSSSGENTKNVQILVRLEADGELVPYSTLTKKPKVVVAGKMEIPSEARSRPIKGSVSLSIVIRTDGTVGGIRIVRGLPFGFTEKAVIAAQKSRFKPGELNGKPVATRLMTEFAISEYVDQGVGTLKLNAPKILNLVEAKYTEAALQNKTQGTVIITALFRKDGTIDKIRVNQGVPDGLTESALETLKQFRFEPALENGYPIDITITMEFPFRLNK